MMNPVRVGRRRAGAIVLSVGLLVGTLTMPGASAQTSINAAGSAEQVYATGLTPGDPVSLLDPQGTVV